MTASAGPDMLVATERLQVRLWRPAEASRLLDIRRRPEVAQWLGDPTPWTNLATAEEKIAEWAGLHAAADPFGVWAVVPRDGGPPAGSVSLNQLPGDTEVEIGWYLHPDSTGRGYATEAAGALLTHATGGGAVPRVWAVMWPSNTASARVATAIGMTDLGVCEDAWYGTVEEPNSRMFRHDAAAG